MKRSPQSIARDIERRFIADYEKAFSNCLDKRIEIQNKRDLTAAKVAAFKRVYSLRDMNATSRDLDYPRLNLEPKNGVHGEIRFNSTGVDLKLSWLPTDVAIKLLALLDKELK